MSHPRSRAAALFLFLAAAPSLFAAGDGYWHTSGNQILDAAGNPINVENRSVLKSAFQQILQPTGT